MNYTSIISQLPYSQPFLFVDELLQIDQNGVTGMYRFPKDSFFYKGHFKDYPVTPGVILTECMAQIGLVCLGMFLIPAEEAKKTKIALSSVEVDFYKPVFPGERVKVISNRIYFRFNKLKCRVEMFDAEENLICRGAIAGMLKNE